MKLTTYVRKYQIDTKLNCTESAKVQNENIINKFFSEQNKKFENLNLT